MREDWWSYAWLAIAAWFGVLARAARWTTPEGKFDWRKALLECLSAPGIGIITGGLVDYLSPDMDQKIVNGIAALMGLLGVAAIEALFTTWFQKKVGSL